MSIKKEKISGKMIDVEIKSSGLKSASYNCMNGSMTITFNSGSVYKYNDVPLDLFTKFRLAKSQGQFFNKQIAPNFTYKKLKK